VVLSPSGKKLAATKFPQPSIERPALMDVNGDGVADVVVTTTDAVWAYVVVLRASSTSMDRVGAGFVLLGILLALLRNRFQRRPGKRTTDVQ
jgi:FG-GAP repeat